MALEPSRISDFQIAGAIGSGATARVFEAVHIASGRAVAIKMLEPSARGSELRERFAREALLLSGVKSRHVGQILGFGFEQGQPFLVLERLHGETLDAKLRRDGPVPLKSAVPWLEQVMVGVRDIHATNVIHRDIKPANIFLHTEAGAEAAMVKLIDFGVARLQELAGVDGGLTSTNHLIGSMGYMAPEQFRSAKTGGFGADIYALGVVCFRTITGQLPFISRSLEAVIKMKCEREPPLVSSIAATNPIVPRHERLDWFVSKAMAREPQNRFASAREMYEVWMRVSETFAEDISTSIDSIQVDFEEEDPSTIPETNVGPPPPPQSGQIPSSGRTLPSSSSVVTLPRPAPGPGRPEDWELTKSHPQLRSLVLKELEVQQAKKKP